jgi:predicted SprT family Zn-dependent metalloprotease
LHLDTPKLRQKLLHLFLWRTGVSTEAKEDISAKSGRVRQPAAKVRTTKSTPKDPSLLLFNAYVATLERYGASEDHFKQFDLSNDFYWLFRLNDLLTLADKTFERINRVYFSGTLPKPQIAFCRRSTGGFYDHRKRFIGISIAMTVEFGESEFLETLLHEIAHIRVRAHNGEFYELLHKIGGTGRKAPRTRLLELKQTSNQLKRYPILVCCPNCGLERRYRTRRALHFACRACCAKHNGGAFDTRFLLQEVITRSTNP